MKLKETHVPKEGNGSTNVLQAFRNYSKNARESWQVWRKVPRSAYHLFLTTIGINSLVAGCQIYFVVYATEVLDISASGYAVVMALMYVGIALPALLAGYGMDVKGRKLFLLLGYAMYIPAMLLFVVANIYLLIAALVLFGLGNMIRVNSSQVLLGDLVPRALRGNAVGSLQFFLYIGQACAFLLVGFLYAYVAPWLPFVLLAAATVPLGLVVALKIHEPKVQEV